MLRQLTIKQKLFLKCSYRLRIDHLRGRERSFYNNDQQCNVDDKVSVIADDDGLEKGDCFFKNALELYNRKSVRDLLQVHPEDESITEMCTYFYKSVGTALVNLKLCVECGDSGKWKFDNDEYYMNITEVSHIRTVLCSRCMLALMENNIDAATVEQDLEVMRTTQPNGVYVDPYLLACGY